jgi:hypothetical protein
MKSQNLIVLIIVVILGAIIFWKRDAIKRRFGIAADSTDGSSKPGTWSSPSGTSAPVTPGIEYKKCTGYPLKLGCSGENVLNLQKTLNKMHGAGISADGYFGPQTEAALIKLGYGETLEMSETRKIATTKTV